MISDSCWEYSGIVHANGSTKQNPMKLEAPMRLRAVRDFVCRVDGAPATVL